MIHRVLASLIFLCAACSEKPTPAPQATSSAMPVTASAQPAPAPSTMPGVPASADVPPAPGEFACGRPPAPGVACVHPKSRHKACEENWRRPLTGCAPDAKAQDRCDDGFVGYCKHEAGLVTYFYGSANLPGGGTLADGCKSAGGLFCEK